MPRHGEGLDPEFDEHKPDDGLTELTLDGGFTVGDLDAALDLGERMGEARRTRAQQEPEGGFRDEDIYG